MRGIYIHVPLCLTKCGYCDFYSVKYGRDLAQRYAKAAARNADYYARLCGEPFDTVYFGGGTPILVSEYISEIMANIPHTKAAEVTVEANPCIMTEERLSQLLSAGVNRLSVGIQSLCDDELSALGRRHNADTAQKSILFAKKMGFQNISADVMLGIPRQSAASLCKTLEGLFALPITHISAYMLKIEPNTPFGTSPPALPDEEETVELYLKTVQRCAESGFAQYEISNFAKNGYESRHNLKYWRREEYIGIGPAAHSFYGGKRFAVPRDIDGFIAAGRQSIEMTDEFPNEFEERIMLGLRLAEGIPEALWKPLEAGLRFVPREYYAIKGGRLSLTPAGFALSNEIIVALLAHREG